MPNQHKTPSISWHSADPTLKPWIENEASTRGVSLKEYLDEVLAAHRARRGMSGRQAPGTTETTGETQ